MLAALESGVHVYCICGLCCFLNAFDSNGVAVAPGQSATIQLFALNEVIQAGQSAEVVVLIGNGPVSHTWQLMGAGGVVVKSGNVTERQQCIRCTLPFPDPGTYLPTVYVAENSGAVLEIKQVRVTVVESSRSQLARLIVAPTVAVLIGVLAFIVQQAIRDHLDVRRERAAVKARLRVCAKEVLSWMENNDRKRVLPEWLENPVLSDRAHYMSEHPILESSHELSVLYQKWRLKLESDEVLRRQVGDIVRRLI